MIARGAWADTLRTEGLRIRHYIQRKNTADHPRVLETPGEEQYDIVFAVMQYRQMEVILYLSAQICAYRLVYIADVLIAGAVNCYSIP